MRVILALSVLLTLSTPSYGSGFLLLEQSPGQMGHAYAGSTALAKDASTVFFNPAGMSELEGQNLTGGLSHVMVDISFEDRGSTQTGVGPLSGSEGGDPGGSATLPSVFYVYGMGEWAFGIGVYVPFGLTTKYDKNWKGRYQGIESSVQATNINPSVSYQVNERLSVGAGLNYQILKAKLTNAIDIGSICVATQTEALGDAGQAAAACAAQGLSPQSSDAMSEISGDSTGFGYNLGFLYKVSDQWRVGLSYRSSVIHKVNGEATYQDVPEAFTAGGQTLVDTDVETKAELPAVIALGTTFQLNPAITLLGDLSWTGWSSFDELKIKYDSAQDDHVEEFNWRDTFRLATGVRYNVNKQWVSSAGLAYDQGPIKGRKQRNVRLPDNDRYWATLGGEYRPATNLSLALSYAHLFIENAQVERSNDFGHNIKGTYKASIDIVAFQVDYAI